MNIGVESLIAIIGLQVLNALFTGLVLAVVLVVVLRLFKVRSVTVERDSDSRDQDRSD